MCLCVCACMQVYASRLELAGDSVLTASEYCSFFRMPHGVENAVLICLVNRYFSFSSHLSHLKSVPCDGLSPHGATPGRNKKLSDKDTGCR